MDDAGWNWFDEASLPSETGKDVLLETAEAFARTFRSPDGQTGLPASDDVDPWPPSWAERIGCGLRHLEGQRQLVGYLAAMIERGGGRIEPEPALDSTPKVRKRKSLWTRIF